DEPERFIDHAGRLIRQASPQQRVPEYQKLIIVIESSGRSPRTPDILLHTAQALCNLAAFVHRPSDEQRSHEEDVAALLLRDANHELGQIAAWLRLTKELPGRCRPPSRMGKAWRVPK